MTHFTFCQFHGINISGPICFSGSILNSSHQKRGSKVSSKKYRDSGDLSSSDCCEAKLKGCSYISEQSSLAKYKSTYEWQLTKSSQFDVDCCAISQIKYCLSFGSSKILKKLELTVLMGMTGPASWVAIFSSSSWKDYNQFIYQGNKTHITDW